MTDTPLDTWITEERTVEVDVPDMQADASGNLRQVGTKKETRTITEKVAYTQLVPQQVCAQGEHVYSFVDGDRRQPNARLLVKCQRCLIGRHFVLVLQRHFGF